MCNSVMFSFFLEWKMHCVLLDVVNWWFESLEVLRYKTQKTLSITLNIWGLDSWVGANRPFVSFIALELSLVSRQKEPQGKKSHKALVLFLAEWSQKPFVLLSDSNGAKYSCCISRQNRAE